MKSSAPLALLPVTLLFLLPAAAAAAAEPKPLRRAAEGKFLVGAAVVSSALADPATAKLVAGQFNTLTAENEFKPTALQPAEGKFNFAPADRLVAFAREHDMRVVG